jgi:hypothetical protein
MKKNTTRLQLTKVTVRVLEGTELSAVRGGAEVALLGATNPTRDPLACAAAVR